jgi:hypothetical protein
MDGEMVTPTSIAMEENIPPSDVYKLVREGLLQAEYRFGKRPAYLIRREDADLAAPLFAAIRRQRMERQLRRETAAARAGAA